MNLAILGTGFIVKEVVLRVLKEIPEIKPVAIFSLPRSREKAEELARMNAIPKVYTNYEELLADSTIDFVYVGLINSVHYEYTKLALLAGKNVIVEKPFASTTAEVEELRELALQRNLYVFEAVTLLYLPNFAAIKKELPKIGRIRAVTANYSQYSSRYDKYLRGEVLPAFNPKLSGGALYDINIYNINLIVGLFGAPAEVNYTANIGFNGVDTSGILVLKYENFFASALGAKDSESPSFALIQGEKGWIKVSGTPNELKSFEIYLRETGTTTKFELNRYEFRMVHEFKEFAQIYQAKDFDRMKNGLDISVMTIRVAESARKQVGIIFSCDGV